MRRTPPQRELDAIDGFFVSLDERFHAAVGQILNVAVDAFSCRPRSREHPEADPLHTSTDQETPRDDHETMIIPARCGRAAAAPMQVARGRVGGCAKLFRSTVGSADVYAVDY